MTWPKTEMTKRNRLIASGMVGLIVGGLLTVVAAGWAIQAPGAPLIQGRVATLSLMAFVLVFSLAEIPLMVVALRKIAASPGDQWVLMLANGAFVFFAAFYAAPFTVLTRQVAAGVGLAGICLLRLLCSFLFVMGSNHFQPSGDNQ